MTYLEELDAQALIYETLQGHPKEVSDRILRNVTDALARSQRHSNVRPLPKRVEAIEIGLPPDAA